MNIQYKVTKDVNNAKEYASCIIDGSIVKIDNQQFDVAELQQDSQLIIDIFDESGNYLVNILIPGVDYTYTADLIEGTEDKYLLNKIKQPINLDKVTIILWEKEKTFDSTHRFTA